MASRLAHVAFLSSSLALLLAVLLVTAIGLKAPASSPRYPKQHLLVVRSKPQQQQVRDLSREHHDSATTTAAATKKTEFGRQEVEKVAIAAARERRVRGWQRSKISGSRRISAEGYRWKNQDNGDMATFLAQLVGLETDEA